MILGSNELVDIYFLSCVGIIRTGWEVFRNTPSLMLPDIM